MDRSTGTPVGFALLLLFAVGLGWVVLGGPDRDAAGHGVHVSRTSEDAALAAYFRDPAAVAAKAAEPALVWPQQMPGPITDYVGRRVTANGLQVTSVDADEGFWVSKDGQRAWIQIETAAESPYTVKPGDVVSISGRVLPHDPSFPSRIYFCANRQAAETELSRAPTHFAVLVDEVTFGAG